LLACGNADTQDSASGSGDTDTATATQEGIDLDGDGVEASEDCDDEDASVGAPSTEICDGLDNDCDGSTDEPDAADAGTWYLDHDQDGYGSTDYTWTSCQPPDGYIADDSDCDDLDAEVNPAATEICDGIDNDCNGQVDGSDAAEATAWYADSDQDGFGDVDDRVVECEAPEGYVADSTDCDDDDAGSNPSLDEVHEDLADNDCDGEVDEACGRICTYGFLAKEAADMSVLRDCDEIHGYVFIEAPDLTDLDDLACLQVLDGYMFVKNIDAMESFELPLLTEITDYWYMTGSTVLESVDLPALRTLGGYFMFRNQEMVKSVDLGALETVDGYLYFSGNPVLESLDLGSLTTVTDYVFFSDNPSYPQCAVDLLAEQLGESVSVSSSGCDQNATCE
jgi:hypothetical protein